MVGNRHTGTQVWRVRTSVVGDRVPHPMIKHRNSKGFTLARRELKLVCLLVPWQGRIERGEKDQLIENRFLGRKHFRLA